VGVPLSAVSVPNPDTAITPYDHGVSSSRTTFHMGNCIQRAGRDLRNKLLLIAAEVLAKDPARLMISEGNIIEAGDGRRMTLKELLAKKFNGKSGAIFAEGHYTPAGNPILEAREGLKGISSIFWMFATHAAEVEVDTETGVVKVLKVAAAHDIGRAVNPMGCEQQIEGSVILGVSNTLFEEFKMDRGRILNDSFSDYKLATMEDLPEIVSILIGADPDKEALAVVKGIGEPAAAATAPAIANAIFNAVGVRIKDLPITPDKVLAALRVKEEQEGR
jgi:CO/xanthine dehydrogenase Mo-binding subunit